MLASDPESGSMTTARPAGMSGAFHGNLFITRYLGKIGISDFSVLFLLLFPHCLFICLIPLIS